MFNARSFEPREEFGKRSNVQKRKNSGVLAREYLLAR